LKQAGGRADICDSRAKNKRIGAALLSSDTCMPELFPLHWMRVVFLPAAS
jgi:hypothetical protein